MPIYEFRCDDCGADFEKRVARVADRDSVECPSCGQRRLTQKYSTFSAVMGGGSRSSEAPSCAMSGGCPNRGMCGMG